MGLKGAQSLPATPAMGVSPHPGASPSFNQAVQLFRLDGCLLFGAVMVAVATAAAAETASSPVSPLEIVIPAELGYVTEAPSQATGTTLVHIQEAHTNFEGQQNLAAILEQLIKAYGLTLVMVEGGEGSVSLAALREFGSLEDRKAVAEKYLRAGILSGEEYLELVSDFPLQIWGVEEPALYRQNVDAYLEVDGLRAGADPLLAPFRTAIQRLADQVLDPAVRTLDRQSAEFAQDRLPLAEYADALAAHVPADAAGTYPEFHRFQTLRRQEQAIDFDRIEQVQAALVQQLEQRLGAQALTDLQAHMDGVTQGTRSRASLYARLAQDAAAAGVALARELAEYITYVQEGDRLDPAALSDELQQVVAAARAARATSPAQHAVARLVDEVELVGRLIELSLSPQDFQRVRALELPGMARRWQDWYASAAPSPASKAMTGGLTQLEVTLPRLVHFYDLALRRDEVLARNTLSKLQESGVSVAVLITGGFHSPTITQRMKEAGIRIVTVTPKATQATDERLYRAVLKYKSGHGTLDEVMALHEQQSAAPQARGAAEQQGALRP